MAINLFYDLPGLITGTFVSLKQTAMKTNKLLSLFIFNLSLFTLSAQSGVKTKSVAVFKNGSGFFVKSGNVKPKNGEVRIDDTINATFGTLWFSSNDNTIKSVTSKMEQVEYAKPSQTANTSDLLKANIGKKVKITAKDEEPVEGTIEKADDDMVILKEAGKWVHYRISWLNRIDFMEQPSYYVTSKDNTMITRVDLKDDKECNLNMMYLQKGISWLPTYLVELGPDNKAYLTLTANLVNDAEDLDNADVSLVVGVPNFKYSNLLSPLTSTQSISEFLFALNYQSTPTGGTFSNGNTITSNMVAQSVVYNEPSLTAGQGEFEKPNESFNLNGTKQEDLFFYRLNSISLKKGGRGLYTVLKETVPFRHIYETELNANTESGAYYGNSTDLDNSGQNINKVYHSIEIENTSKLPWTTGSAMVVKPVNGINGPLSQDELAYTPMKAKVCVKITEAPDISVKDGEVEISREEKKKTVHKTAYDLITVDANITVKNYKDEDIDLTVKRTINGDLISTSSDWTSKKIVSLYRSANITNNVKWEIHLKAGEEKKITYRYKVYVER